MPRGEVQRQGHGFLYGSQTGCAASMQSGPRVHHEQLMYTLRVPFLQAHVPNDSWAAALHEARLLLTCIPRTAFDLMCPMTLWSKVALPHLGATRALIWKQGDVLHLPFAFTWTVHLSCKEPCHAVGDSHEALCQQIGQMPTFGLLRAELPEPVHSQICRFHCAKHHSSISGTRMQEQSDVCGVITDPGLTTFYHP